MHAPDQNILHWTSITTVHTAIKLKLANALSWILLLDYLSKPRKVRTKLAGTCSDLKKKWVKWLQCAGTVSRQISLWIDVMIVNHHHDYSLFHLILGCSIRHLAVPFDICPVPFDIWLFHSTFRCSIRHLAVPFDIWLFRFACVASLFVFNLNHLTNTYAISSPMARPNRCSLYHFDES